MRLIREKLIADAKAKEIIDNLGDPDEMKYKQKNAYDNLKKFVVVDPKKIKSLVEELSKNKKLRTRQIISIANILPDDKDDLRTILHKEYSNFDADEIDLILKEVRKVNSD